MVQDGGGARISGGIYPFSLARYIAMTEMAT
jgi:hypothetical protein